MLPPGIVVCQHVSLLCIFSIFSLLAPFSSCERLKLESRLSPELQEVDFETRQAGFQAGFFNPSAAAEKWLEKSGRKYREENPSPLSSSKSSGTVKADAGVNRNDMVPIAKTPLGDLRGSVFTSRSGRCFYGFKGIPYAKNVTRFEMAELVEPWGNMRDARESGPICLQSYGAQGIQGEENCLFIDIYHPLPELCQSASETSTGKLPVLVNIHGGGFVGGSGKFYTPEYFLDHCVVYCTINYRLGVLGFLATEDGVIQGNLGLKDQVLALEWIQKYIEFFGGDKNSVTCMGISAGGASVSHLILSPMATGLIHGGIAMSGNALCPWAIAEKPGETARFIAALVGCPTDTNQMKNCLKGKDAKDLIAAQVSHGGILVLGPVVEPENSPRPFLIKHPYTVYKSGDFNKVPLMAGSVEDEGISLYAGDIFYYSNLLAQLNDAWNEHAPVWLLYDKLTNCTEEERNHFSSQIRQFYFGNESISNDNRQKLVDLFTDRMFEEATFKTIDLHSQFAEAYPYLMSYKSGVSSAVYYGYEVPRITHGDDQFLFFPFIKYECCTEQYDFSARVVKYWVNFAQTGSPGEELWKPRTEETNTEWFQLNTPNKILYNYKNATRVFWENLGINEKEFSSA